LITPCIIVFDNIRADFRRYLDARRTEPVWLAVPRSLLAYGFLSTVVYRYGRWCRQVQPRWLSFPFKLVYAIASTLTDILFGINFSTNAVIGPGLYIPHFGGIFLHGHMGSQCTVAQGVTVGYKGAGKSTFVPRIGDEVYIGTGAVVIGDIEVGHRAVIGANTTVVKSVGEGATVVAAAARVIAPM
jgi:serine O-acetyltransferase